MWISWFQSLPYKCNLYRCYAMQGKYDKTPDRDRDRKGGLGIKLGEQNAAYGAAVLAEGQARSLQRELRECVGCASDVGRRGRVPTL